MRNRVTVTTDRNGRHVATGAAFRDFGVDDFGQIRQRRADTAIEREMTPGGFTVGTGISLGSPSQRDGFPVIADGGRGVLFYLS